MSARVLNPTTTTMMTETGRNPAVSGGRAMPSRAALARVRRDLFGPVDHAAARALAENELRTQSLLDAERWGFDFHLEVPRANSRYEWELVTAHDIVPEPYALRGMPYLKKHAPGTPCKSRRDGGLISTTTSPSSSLSPSSSSSPLSSSSSSSASSSSCSSSSSSSSSLSSPSSLSSLTTMKTTTRMRIIEKMETSPASSASLMIIDDAERTPPQEPRVPEIGDVTISNELYVKRKECTIEPTTPTLPLSARKQSTITDFMKSRKRGLNGTTKSMIEPPEKITRNTGQIRS